MSLTTDSLSKATPTRLYCSGGRWVLEVSRLEAVDRDVYETRLQRLEGADSILAMLRRSEASQLLVSGATQLMRGPRSDEDRAYEVTEGEWVPSGEAPETGHTSPRDEQRATELSRALAELRAELLLLRASHVRLRERVASLEAHQEGLPPANARVPRGSRARRRSEPPSAPPPAPLPVAPLGFAATQASPSPFTPAASGPARTPPEVVAAAKPEAQPSPLDAPQTMEDLARAISPPTPLPPLKPPSLRAVIDCLNTLVDQPLKVEQSKTPFVLDQLKDLKGAKLLDDEGRERGVMLSDLGAAVTLGGALLCLPKPEVLRQIAERDPSEDALLAMSEVCNNLTGPVNAVEGNSHIRATAIESFELSALSPLRARLELIVEGFPFLLGMY